VVTHTEDITRPLGLDHAPDPEAVVACLNLFQNTSFPLGAKKRIAGLRLAARDVDWNHGDGPEVTGPGMSLVMVMAGRAAGLDGLGGAGLAELQGRMN
jgi:hypothetical protein